MMPTPQQRLQMGNKSWKLIREKKVFLADFWNQGQLLTDVYLPEDMERWNFYIDWNGNVAPCVFMPYSPVNIKEVYARVEI